MSLAITTGASSAASAAYGGGGPSAASLQAQLQRYQQQLSDCVNCASAKTPKGKQDIQAISARIGQIEQRIAQADGSGARAAPDAPQAASTPAPASGNLIDVFA